MERLKNLWFDIEFETISKLLLSIFLIALLTLIGAILRKVITKNIKDLKLRYNWLKATEYTLMIIGIFFVGRVWFQGFQSFATFLGLLSAGIAIALKDIMLNMAGWLFIIWRKPFDVGQRIQIGENKGDVIDIGVFMFTVLELGNWVDAEQSTGRMIHIPNGHVFLHPIYNYESGFSHIWNELTLTITFESNWQKAKQLLTDILETYAPKTPEKLQQEIKEASQFYMIYFQHLTPIVYTTINQRGIELYMRYISLPRERRKYQNIIWEEILKQFAQHNDIQFAYPTTRFVNNANEWKIGGKE